MSIGITKIRKFPSNTTSLLYIIAFPLQQLLHEHGSVLRYTYIDCLRVIWSHSSRMRLYRTQYLRNSLRELVLKLTLRDLLEYGTI